MRVAGVPYRSIAVARDGWAVEIVDQTALPHAFRIARLETPAAVAEAIRTMRVRGAPLIGAAAAYGIALAMRADPSDHALDDAVRTLLRTRPTAVNLRATVDDMDARLRRLAPGERVRAAYARAGALCDADVEINRAIGRHGLPLIRDLAGRLGRSVNVMTHCNAGWLATVDLGTALAPVYLAHAEAIPVHVWVSETRPRNQGALTAWELAQEGVPHTVFVDSAAGYLMQGGRVDLCLVGTDRTTVRGDVANKIGTYPKALAARAHGVPFYVAAPSPSIDWTLEDGREIPIEERDAREVTGVTGANDAAGGDAMSVRIVPRESPVVNVAFDVTPADLVTGLITERGICPATRDGLARLFPERLV
jgi:methylthioribose-1-phosphate isomerase